jgi:8-oxo-dGTP diphosphatase
VTLRKRWFTLVQIAYDLFLKLNPRKLAAHAVILDDSGRVLVLRSRYADVWALPGGGVGPGEHLDEAMARECREELGVPVTVGPLTGMYYHANIRAYVAVFRVEVPSGDLRLSHEHTAYRWTTPPELPPRLRQVVEDALTPAGAAAMRSFR